MTIVRHAGQERDGAALRPQFEITLHYREGQPPLSDEPGRTGEYIGSGDGRIDGEALSGTVTWDLWERVEETVCEANLRGVIATEDGAEIRFDTLGFFRRPTEEGDSHWVNSSAVTFATDEPRYLWLTERTALLQGVFDMASYRHDYRIYWPANGRASA